MWIFARAHHTHALLEWVIEADKIYVVRDWESRAFGDHEAWCFDVPDTTLMAYPESARRVYAEEP